MRSSCFLISRFCLLAGCAVLLSACSTTPDRYAFWRDVPPADTAPSETSKPNLADIPASPDVSQARQDMQDLQTKLAADRNAAYTQAQADKNTMNGSVAPLAPISSGDVASDNLPPVGANATAMNMPSAISTTPPTAMGLPTALQMPAALAPAPAMANPNTVNPNAVAGALPTWPVYVPPSVQINTPVRPYAMAQSSPDYVYGRSGVQFRQQMNANGSVPIPASTIPVNNQNVTVDMSALGGSLLGGPRFGGGYGLRRPGMPDGTLSNMPAIYFKHGSTRLSPNDRKKLASFAATAKSTNRPVKLVGHASTRTKAKSVAKAKAINLKVSADRTEHVLQALTKQGVPSQQINATALGDVDARQAPSEAAARRVDVLIGQ